MHTVHADHPRLILVSPELSQVNRVQILHFPSDRPDDVVRPGHTVDFRIVKNGAHGIVTVHVIAPSGAAKQRRTKCDVIELSADSYAAYVPVTEAGVYSVHVRFNDVEVPRSPLTFHSVAPAANE